MRIRPLMAVVLGMGVVCGQTAILGGEEARVSSVEHKVEKRIFAHYMGCYPVAAAATASHRAKDAHRVRHDGKGQFDAIGDRWRNWPLVPDGMKVDLEASADLEIRRALRAGIDGFAVDAWAGDAKNCVLEVLTILTAPAQVRLPGRDAQWDAPAGMSYRQFPLTPGPVSAELVRAGHAVLCLDSPEPITDRPFRETNAMTCFSTEFTRHWRADFGEAPPLLRGEYADDDQDGLPNWFEMYWFGKFLDWTTATAADPKTLGKDGKTNLQHYLDQTAPLDLPSARPSGK